MLEPNLSLRGGLDYLGLKIFFYNDHLAIKTTYHFISRSLSYFETKNNNDQTGRKVQQQSNSKTSQVGVLIIKSNFQQSRHYVIVKYSINFDIDVRLKHFHWPRSAFN